jgi:hypothetical protein
MFSFAVDYFVMVFLASLGVMQTAASIGGLRGLLVFKNPLIARALGIAVAIAALVCFFLIEERNINDYKGGLDSNEQGLLFFLAVATSGMFTCVLTSLVNWRMHRNIDGAKAQEAGLGALRDGNWWQAIGHNYRNWFSEGRCWRTQIKRYFSG